MFQSFLSAINPGRNLAARIALIFSALSVFFALMTGLWTGNITHNAVERDQGQFFADRAQHVAQAIDVKLDQSIAAMDLAAHFIGSSKLVVARSEGERLITSIRKNLQEAVLIGIADADGQIIAIDKTSDLTSIAETDWFRAALVSRVVAAPVSLTLSNTKIENLALIARPIKDADDMSIGVVFAGLQMDWMKDLWRESSPNFTDAVNTELQVLSADGVQLLPNTPFDDPAVTIARIESDLAAKPDKGKAGFFVQSNHLLGYAKSTPTKRILGSGWLIILQEPLNVAYQSADMIASLIGMVSLLFGLALSAFATFATWLMTRKLSQIATTADALRLGQAQTFSPLSGSDEPARISRSLAQLFDSLKVKNFELADMNRNLDQKVAERTREVQRLSEETRNAAMTRERLRLARDLHDTLAHSLLAMLTQIRLMKKLLVRKPEALGEELEHAEKAAQEGLNSARSAVLGLRYFAVRDDGLEEALRKAVSKLQERTEIEAHLFVDPAAAALSGPKAETAYRVVEEALHNVERHANAKAVNINVTLDQISALEHKLKLVITDDGKGFSPSARKRGHFGIIGMREQAEVMGGTLDIKTAPGNGTKLTLVMPM